MCLRFLGLRILSSGVRSHFLALGKVWDFEPGARDKGCLWMCLRPPGLQVKLSLSPIPVSVNALVDLGSSDYFIDFALISKYHLPCQKINPCLLAMIDGTINHLVNHVMSLPIRLPCLYSFQIEFFVTKLEGTTG